MVSGDFTVLYVDASDCFIHVSAHTSNLFKSKNVEICTENGKKLMVTISSRPLMIQRHCIGINPLFASALEIHERSKVSLNSKSDLQSLKSVSLTTTNDEDFIVLNSVYQKIEQNLLNHINVVNVGQKVVLWPTKIVVNVEKTFPVNIGVLKPDTVLEIDFKGAKTIESSKDASPEQTRINVRVLPINKNKENCFKIFEDPFGIFMWKDSCSMPNNTICVLAKTEDASKKLYLQLFILDEFYHQLSDVEKIYINKNFPKNKMDKYTSVYVQSSVMASSDIKFGSKAFLEPVVNKSSKLITSPKLIKVFVPESCDQNRFRVELKRFLSEKTFVFINSKVPFFLRHNFLCYFVLDSAEFAFLRTNDLIENIEVFVDYQLSSSNYKQQKKNGLEQIFSDLYLDVKISVFDSIRCSLKQTEKCKHSLFPENVVISGSKGSGKSTLCKRIACELSESPSFFYIKTLNCKQNFGKSTTMLSKMFSKIFLKLKSLEPSLLVLEDLQCLCGKSTSNENQIYFNRVSTMLKSYVESFQNQNYISVLGTCDSLKNLNENIYSSKGMTLFPKIFELPPLTNEIKKNLFEFYMSKNKLNFNKLLVDDVVLKLDGFVVQDISDLVKKACYEVIKNNDDNTIEMSMFETVFKKFKPLTMSNVSFSRDSAKSMSEIGGLKSAKTILAETIEWPLKYPKLFENAPIRIQTGILLFGPPGTGKTLLANSVAKHYHIRLITVKGPELLSKFVGASEQSVRKVFEKAQNAKPCILFFDEFESLVPKRGSDNIGVTDRVVNQFLTQLDGVETLNGVFVIAASSRPDLIDPALLRPGRLDKHILCDVPNKIERLEILTKLKLNYDLNDDVDLAKIAELTRNYTGADLQALLYTAQLEIVENHLKNTDIRSSSKISLSIKMDNILKAFETTKPCLNDLELSKFRQIYKNFSENRLKIDVNLNKQKMTQA